MKIQREHSVRRDERGLATIIIVCLLAIMMILVTAEIRALYNLHRETQLLEQQQIKRLNNSQPVLVDAEKPDSK
jgi:type II secretory pathway component PulK